LQNRRIRTIAIETFKIIHRKIPQYLHDLIDIKARSYNFRSKNTAAVPRVRTTRYGMKSFRYNAAQIWNGSYIYQFFLRYLIGGQISTNWKRIHKLAG
jgi:hypothetical protein